PFLQAILEHSQMQVRGLELLNGTLAQQSLPHQLRQDLAQLAALQPSIAAAANQLECLHDELDLANAARAELDVVLQLAPLHLARDHRFHVPQGLEHAEIEITPIDE